MGLVSTVSGRVWGTISRWDLGIVMVISKHFYGLFTLAIFDAISSVIFSF